MSKAALFPLAAVVALAAATLLHAAPPPAKPLTESELLDTLDKLGKGDPVNKAPLGVHDVTPAPRSPSGTRAKIATPAPAKPDKPVAAKSDNPALPTNDAPTKSGTPAPKPKKLKPGEAPDPNAPPPGQTVITSEEGAFDQKLHRAIFTKKVLVVNPDFTLTCEKLTAFMKHDDSKIGAKAPTDTPGSRPPATPAPVSRASTPDEAAATPPSSPTKASPGASPKPPRMSVPTVAVGGTAIAAPADKTEEVAAKTDAATDKTSGLDHAIAEINVEIVQDKVDEDGNVQHNVGHGKKAVYESSTGDITLTGKPDVQQGPNSCVALSEDTIIILNRDGHMRTLGPAKNIIVQQNSGDATPSPKSKATPAPANGR